MPQRFKRAQFILLFMMLLLYSSLSYSQNNKDSAINTINRFVHLYKEGKLSQQPFLDTVHSTMRSFLSQDIFFSNKELLNLLSPYRNVIWKYKAEEHKRNYYGMLSNQAQMSGRDGEMLYYAEKLNELEEKEKNLPSFTSLTIIASYYNSKNSFQFSQTLFEKNKKIIVSIPEMLQKNQLDVRQTVQASNMLGYFSEALYQVKDIKNADIVDSILSVIESYAMSNFDNGNAIANIKYVKTLSLYEKGEASHSKKEIAGSLDRMKQLVNSNQTPEYLKNYIQFSLTDKKIIYFLEENNADSASYYLKAFESQYKKGTTSQNAYMIMKYKSKLLYQQSNYKSSVDTLVQALIILEEFKRNIVQDINDMMYSQAKADEQQILLEEAEATQKRTKRHLTSATVGLLVILISCAFTVRLYRRKQKAKFFEFKLNLARSIHDETNPALLYAKALAKTKNETNAEKSDLEKHIDHTMQLIRSLSHDLKSDKQYNLSDLLIKVTNTLQKLSKVSDFSYEITSDYNKKRFLSHHQYTNLNAILNECIANSIKHAEFDVINVEFKQKANQLTIVYKDNGKGWDCILNDGIGIENIQERISNLNGEFKISNNFPNGYYISFSVLLK